MSTPKHPVRNEADLLAAARGGDARQFGELAEPYRRELQVHCYRILGSVHEAEDMVQETMFKAWKHIGSYEGRASFRSWLYKIATNTCLDFLDTRPSRRQLPHQIAPAADPDAAIAPPSSELLWLEPLPDEWLEDTTAINPEARYSQYEGISFSFLTALQVLPPRQRAVLILRDVLDFSAQETAEVLGLSLSSVTSALHRARKSLGRHHHGGIPDWPGNPAGDEKSKQLLDGFVQAWQAADVNSLVALLKQDAILAMPPSPSWYQGRAAIRQFLARTTFGQDGMFPGPAANRWRLIPVRANAAPGFAVYLRDERNIYQAFGILLPERQDDQLSKIMHFIDPTLPSRFGLGMILK